jgi:hypothetical protein
VKSGLRKLVSRIKAPLSTALLGLLFLAQTLAASPILHLDLHDDAHSTDHNCAIETLSHGHLDLTGPPASLALPLVTSRTIEVDLPQLSLPLFHPVDLSRGPPCLADNTTQA